MGPGQRIVAVQWASLGLVVVECVSLGTLIDNPNPDGDGFHHFPAPEIVQGVGGRIDLHDHRGEPLLTPIGQPIGIFLQEEAITLKVVDYAQIYDDVGGTPEGIAGKQRFIDTISGRLGYGPTRDQYKSVLVYPLITHTFPDGNSVQYHGAPEVKTVWDFYADYYGKPVDPQASPFGTWFNRLILAEQHPNFDWTTTTMGELVWERTITRPQHQAVIFRQNFIVDFEAVDPAEFYGRLPAVLRLIGFNGGMANAYTFKKYKRGQPRFVDIDAAGRATVLKSDETPAEIVRRASASAIVTLFNAGGFVA